MNDRMDNATAFTLVEMLVTIFVVAVLISVIVGVSGAVVRRSAVAHTRAGMTTIWMAMEAYRQAEGQYPSEAEADVRAPAGWAQRDWQAYVRSQGLYDQLMARRAGQAALASLATDAVGAPRGGNRTFLDGFGKHLDYFRTRGSKGAPLLLSAGADGDFDRQEDNIRSDDL